jgi:hypothetical protein
LRGGTMLVRVFFAVVALLAAGCQSVRSVAGVDVEIVNDLGRDILSAEVQFGDNSCQFGRVRAMTPRVVTAFPYPIELTSTFYWHEEGRRDQSKKFDLRPIYPPGATGRLIFTVSLGGVTVAFKPN